MYVFGLDIPLIEIILVLLVLLIIILFLIILFFIFSYLRMRRQEQRIGGLERGWTKKLAKASKKRILS